MTEKTNAMSKFETVISCDLDPHANNPDVTFLIDNKMSIHGLKEVAEVTTHDFRLRNSRKDRLISVKEELKGTHSTTLRRRTDRSKVRQARESNRA